MPYISADHLDTTKQAEKKDIPIPILLDGNRNLGLDDGINTSDLISNLPGAFKQ